LTLLAYHRDKTHDREAALACVDEALALDIEPAILELRPREGGVPEAVRRLRRRRGRGANRAARRSRRPVPERRVR
jgi:hypothetical protein